MALIVCSECGKEFSDKAAACPQCGCPTEEVLKSKKNTDTVTLSKEEQALKDNSRETLRDYLESVRILETDCYTYRRIINNLEDSKIQIPHRENEPMLNEKDIREQIMKDMLHEANMQYRKDNPDYPYENFYDMHFYFEEHPIPTKKEYQKWHLGDDFWKASLSTKTYRLKESVFKLNKDYKEFVEFLCEENQEIRDRNRIVDGKVKIAVEKNAQILSYQKECERSKALNEQIDHHITEMQNELNESEKALQQLYELNVIYPKYRGLIPVTMFCEYLDSGRRTVLEGIHGMYDLYESELLGEKIVGQLTEINGTLNKISYQFGELSRKLTGIQRNQIMLYEEVARGNEIAERICQNTGEIANYSKHFSSQMSELKTELQQMNNDLGARLEAIHNSSEKTAYNLEAQTRRVDAIARIEEYEFALKQYPFFK